MTCPVFFLFLRRLLPLGLFVFAASLSASKTEVGFPSTRYFPPSDYGGHSQVFQTVQDENGIIYITNFAAVLAYDGERWTRIEVPDTTFLYGLALLEDGRIAVCGVGQIGYLEPDGKGSMTFHSLLPLVPEQYRAGVGETWDLYVTDQGVFFFAQRMMIRWREDEIRVWEFETERVAYGHWSGSSIYIQNLGHGLFRLDGDEVVPVSDDPLFVNPGPRMIVDWGQGRLLVVTMSEGLWIYDDGVLERFATDADEILAEGIFNRGLVLPDGRLALGTFGKGVVILSREGDFLQHLREGNGLPNEAITHLSLDRELGLWCSLGAGLARVDLSGAVSYYDLRNGLPSVVVQSIQRFGETIYLSSGQGMFRLKPVALPDQPQWEKVDGVVGEMFDVIEHEGALFASVRGTVARVTEEQTTKVWDGADLVRVLTASTVDPNRIYVGTRLGLGAVVRIDGEWQQTPVVPDAKIYAQSIVETVDGTVWVGTQRSGVWRFSSQGEGLDWTSSAVVKSYHEAAGLPPHIPMVVKLEDGKLVVTSIEGRFAWDEENERFEADATSPEEPPLQGWAWDVVVRNEEGTRAWGSVYPLEGSSDDFNLYYGRETVDSSGERRFDWFAPGIFEPIGGVLYEMVEGVDNAILWVGGWTGLMRWDLSKAEFGVVVPTLDVVIRSVVGASGNRISLADTSELDYNSAALRFEYAAPVMGAGIVPEYRTRLEGFEDEWTTWSSTAWREFTNLAEGDYRFEVQARTPFGQAESPAVWTFSVRPPWFRTPAAYFAYLSALAIVVWVIVRWRLAAAKRENVRLEGLVSERTSELQQSESNLRSARDEAERANRAKSQFLANMSHELRTPLNGILGYAQVLSRDVDLSSKNRERVAIVESSGKHLLKLINEVLDLSKIEAGRMEVRLAPVELEGLVRTASSIFHQRLDEQGLEFSVTYGPNLPQTVLLDEQKAGQVLFNFLGNAVKFTRQGRIELRIACGSGPERIKFTVTDTGPGISKKDQADIFKPFKQLEANSSAEPGTGLGLAISSKLVEAMEGSIGLESEEGKGSSFWFELPLREVEQDERQAASSRANRIRCAREGVVVLVVDDVAVNRGVVREILEPLGFKVVEADGGEAALRFLEKQLPDLVMLDMRMEPMDGAETVRRLRESDKTRQLPVLAFSASALGFTREDARSLGCDDFITKPFEWDDLLDKLGSMLGLEWIEESAHSPSGGNVPNLAPVSLPAEDLVALKALALRGEPKGLRSKLKDLDERRPDLAPLLKELELLVSKFKLRELSERLDELEAES